MSEYESVLSLIEGALAGESDGAIRVPVVDLKTLIDGRPERDRQVAERAWDEGRDAVIRYSLKHVANEPDEIAGYIDQHIVGIGGSKLDNPYRKEQENNPEETR